MHCTPTHGHGLEQRQHQADLQSHSPIPSFLLVQNSHWETRDTLREPGLVTALSLCQSSHTPPQTAFSTPSWLCAFPLSFQEHGPLGGSTEQKRTRDTKRDLSKIVQQKTSTGCLKNDEKNIRVNSIHVLNVFNVCSV